MRRITVIIKNGLILTLTSLLMRSVGFSFSIYLSNSIGTEALGIFQLIMSVYLFFITLATSGINIATTKVIVAELAHHHQDGVRKAMKSCLLYSFLFGVFACFLLFFGASRITHFFLHDKIPSYLLSIIAISLPFIAISSAFNGYFNAFRKDAKNAINRVFEQFVKIISTTLLLSFLLPKGLEYALLALIIGETISEILSCFCAFLFYIFDKKPNLRSFVTKNYFKEITRISLPIAITSYVRSGLSSLKQLLIPLRLEKSGLSCSNALSKYGLITGMVMPVLLFPEVIMESFSRLLIPEFSYYYEQNDTTKIRIVISKIFKVSLLFSIAIVGMFFFYSDEISLLIYQNTNTSSYLVLLCPILLFMYLDNIVDSMLKGLDKQLAVMGCNIMDLFISIFCIYFLLPIFGIDGFILTIFISELFNSTISILQLRKATNFRIDFFNWIFKPFLGICFSFFCTQLLGNIFPFLNSFFFSLFSYFIFYFFFLTITKCYQKTKSKEIS